MGRAAVTTEQKVTGRHAWTCELTLLQVAEECELCRFSDSSSGGWFTYLTVVMYVYEGTAGGRRRKRHRFVTLP